MWKANKNYKIPVIKRIKYALKGYCVDEYVIYDFDHNDYNEYISENDRLRSRDIINGNYKILLDDKLIFEELVGKYVKVPRNYAWINEGVIYGLHGNGMNNDNYIDYLKEYGLSVLKKNCCGGGEGTYFISYSSDSFYINGKESSVDDVKYLFSVQCNALLCEYIVQSDFARSLYPYTTNTIRIVCAKKKGERRSEFISAVQRVGVKASIPVDNISMGGFAVEIDEKTGKLGEGISENGGVAYFLKPIKSHPETGAVFFGKCIPHWDELVDEIVEVSNRLPFLNLIAWDILLTEDGFCVIEGNASTGCSLFQMRKGVKNDKLGAIFRSYGVFDR